MFVFILSARPRKPLKSQLSDLSWCQRMRSKVSRTHLNLRQLYLYIVLVFTSVFKLLNKLHTILRIIVVFHWIYKPFIFKIFFSNFQIICSRRKIIYSPYLFGGKIERNELSKRKLWKFNIAIKGVYFFFWIYDNRPCHFFRCRFFVLFDWTFAYHFMGRFLVSARERGFLCLSNNL